MQTLPGTIMGNKSSRFSSRAIQKGMVLIPVFVFCLFISKNVKAQFSDVPVTGFNADVVAEGGTNPDASTTTTADVDGVNWLFTAADYYPSAAGAPCNATNSFPTPSITSTNTTNNTGITYTIQPTNANNVLRVLPAASADLTLVTPANAAKLYLVCLGGSGATNFSAQVNFSDGTNEVVTSTAPDWCNGAATYRLTATRYYRILRTATGCTGALCPYLYEIPISISQANFAKIINSISLTNTSTTTAILNVLAVGRRDGFNPGQQYSVNGDASQDDCHTYTLTNPLSGQSGSVWNNNQINLNNSFTFLFDVYLGSIDANGADGMAFVLQPISTSIGGTGSGLGFQGISPSIGVTMDTYQNSMPDSDPVADHIAIQKNGDLDHVTANNLAGPVQIINGVDDAEDGQWHKLKIVWDVTTHTLEAYIDGVLRVSHSEDFVTTTFSGNSSVFWGFTASTGLYFNLQRFKTTLEPHWHFGPAQTLCVGQPITFLDSTIAFSTIAQMTWDFGDGSPLNTTDLNPSHSYTTSGTYTVTQTVQGADGCIETNTQTVIVGAGTIVTPNINDATCSTQGTATLPLSAPGPYTVTWNTTPVQNGVTITADPGTYIATVIDGTGCTSTIPATIGVINSITLSVHADTTICNGDSFIANTQSNATAFTWTPAAGVSDPNIANPVLSPTVTTTYILLSSLQLCDSSRSFTVTVPVVTANAGTDQTITAGQSIQLQTQGSPGTYLWTPATGLSSATALSPLANPAETTTYTFTVTTPEGCTSSDVMTITVKPNVDCAEPMIAITPNGDGINDRWLVGIEGCYENASVHVYNRYGSQVYENDRYKNDWQGTYKGKAVPDATYYFVVDFKMNNGVKRTVKGSLTILR